MTAIVSVVFQSNSVAQLAKLIVYYYVILHLFIIHFQYKRYDYFLSLVVFARYLTSSITLSLWRKASITNEGERKQCKQ